MNRLTQATSDYSFDTAGALSVGYVTDAASNRTSMTDPQSLNTAYGYDVLNCLSTLAFNGHAFGGGSHVNDWGLLDDLGTALAFREFSDKRVTEHAPFYVYEIFRITPRA